MKERKALWVSPETHKAIKIFCAENGSTVDELLNTEFVERCSTCGGANGEHNEVLVQNANNDGGVINDEISSNCPEEV